MYCRFCFCCLNSTEHWQYIQYPYDYVRIPFLAQSKEACIVVKLFCPISWLLLLQECKYILNFILCNCRLLEWQTYHFWIYNSTTTAYILHTSTVLYTFATPTHKLNCFRKLWELIICKWLAKTLNTYILMLIYSDSRERVWVWVRKFISSPACISSSSSTCTSFDRIR